MILIKLSATYLLNTLCMGADIAVSHCLCSLLIFLKYLFQNEPSNNDKDNQNKMAEQIRPAS